jgi:hypothetical protein
MLFFHSSSITSKWLFKGQPTKLSFKTQNKLLKYILVVEENNFEYDTLHGYQVVSRLLISELPISDKLANKNPC